MEEKQYKQNLRLLTNILVYILITLFCILVVPKVIIWFMPFVIGWIISCIANPMVHFLDKKLNVRRKAGTVLVIILVIAAVVGIIYGIGSILVRQLAGFIVEIPNILGNMENDFSQIGSLIDQSFVKLSPKELTMLNSVGSVIKEYVTGIANSVETGQTLGSVTSVVENVANMIIAIIMCMLSAYFFIADREYLVNKIKKMLPKGFQKKYEIFYTSMMQAVGGYFKAQFKIEIWIYFLILAGLLILQINYAFLIALLIAFLDFLPFFGTGAVFWPWAILMVIRGNFVAAIGFVIIWGVGQLVRQIIQPKIVGDSIGVPPIPTLFLLFIGYKIGGVVGMLIAIPVGLILINMNDAGFFDDLKYSVKILAKNINDYRRLTKKDIASVEEDEEVK